MGGHVGDLGNQPIADKSENDEQGRKNDVVDFVERYIKIMLGYGRGRAHDAVARNVIVPAEDYGQRKADDGADPDES